MHTVRPALITALALLATAAPASAATAKFSASLEGTYTQRGTVTNTRCWTSDENDNVTYFTKTGTATENDSFHSVRPITLTVSRLRGQKGFDAGSLQNLKTSFNLNRASDLAGSDEPGDCTPNDRNFARPSDCGSKTLTYALRVYGRQDHPGFSYLFSRNFSTYYPDDPFSGCALAGGVWPGQLQQSGTGRVSVAKLFRRGVRKLVIHGGDGDSKHAVSGSATTDSSYTLTWTLTLRRR